MSYNNDWNFMKLVKDIEKTQVNRSNITDKEAEEAFKTILKWIGENPEREGLKETPKRDNIRNVLSNSFGFGGTNVSLIFKKI